MFECINFKVNEGHPSLVENSIANNGNSCGLKISISHKNAGPVFPA